MISKYEKANTTFALDLFRETFAKSAGKNFACQISPFSIRRALSMAALGARGNTLQAFRDVFQLPSTVNFADVCADSKAVAAHLLTAEARSKNPTELNIANALWLKKDDGPRYKFLESFKEANKNYFNARCKELAFDAAALKEINQWCLDETKKIDKILEELPDDCRAVLTDALYIKTPAHHAFRKEDDKVGTFTPLGGQARPINFMGQDSEEFGYFDGDDLEVLRFPFGSFGRTFNYFLILPKPKAELKNVVAKLNGDNWSEWKRELRQTSGSLLMPSNEQESSANMKDVLCSMGLGIAFDDGKADFLDMCTDPLKIGAVQHKTYTKFLRKGFEGAAVTAVLMFESFGVAMDKPMPFDITVDRPYAWLVEGSNEVLFAATTTDPKEPEDFATETTDEVSED